MQMKINLLGGGPAPESRKVQGPQRGKVERILVKDPIYLTNPKRADWAAKDFSKEQQIILAEFLLENQVDPEKYNCLTLEFADEKENAELGHFLWKNGIEINNN